MSETVASKGAAAPKFFDPLGPLALMPKYKNALMKGKIIGVRVEFTTSGIMAMGQLPPAGDEVMGRWVPLMEAMSSKMQPRAAPQTSFAEDRAYMATKYESRLNEACPVGISAAADAAALEAAVAALTFEKRRALKMSNKEFELAYIGWQNGVATPRPIQQVDEIRRSQSVAKATNHSPGRGRGGRGRGSFRGSSSQAAPEGATQTWAEEAATAAAVQQSGPSRQAH